MFNNKLDQISYKLCSNLKIYNKNNLKWFNYSRISFSKIIETYLSFKKANKVTVLVSRYICKEFLSKIINNNKIRIIYYDIDTDNTIDFIYIENLIKKHGADFFVLTHYYGLTNKNKELLKFLNDNKILIIEDCAHNLNLASNISINSDFVLLSPYKFIGSKKGAILIVNENNLTNKDKYFYEFINSKVFNDKHSLNFFYKIIIIFLNLFLVLRINTLKSNYIILRKYLSEKKQLSFLHPFNKKDFEEINQFFDTYNYKWPSLIDTNDKELNDKNHQFRDNHQFISLIKKLKYKNKFLKDPGNIQINKITKDKYSYLTNSLSNVSLIQSLQYFNSRFKNDNIEYYQIKIDTKICGYIGIVIRKKLFLKINYSNLGPIFLNHINNFQKILIIDSIINKFSNIFTGKIFYYIPNIILDPDSIHYLQYKKKKISLLKSFWSTSIININKNSGNLNLYQQKWRNLLRKGLKSDLKIKIENSYESLIFLKKVNEINQKNKNFSSISSDLLENLYLNFSPYKNIYFFNATHKNKICSSICILINNDYATYLIGWSNDVGKKYCANYLLLHKAIIFLKKIKRISYFDLGGVDNFNTPKIAKFKNGLNGNYIEYSGSYIFL